MAKFAKLFPDSEILQTLSAKLMWSHCTALIDKVKDRNKFIWYVERNGDNGWSDFAKTRNTENVWM
jgi:hypothetical protein